MPPTPKRPKTTLPLLDSSSKRASAAEATTPLAGDADTEKIAPPPIATHLAKANPLQATYDLSAHADEDSSGSMPQLETPTPPAESDDDDSSSVNHRDSNSDSDSGSEKGAAAAGVVEEADTLTDVVICDGEMVALCNIMNQGMKKYN